MKRVKLSLITAAISLALSQSAIAEDLLTVYDLAALNDPSIKAAFADRNAAREFKPQAQSRLVPLIEGLLNVKATDRKLNSNPLSSDVNTNDEFENFGYQLNLTQHVYHHDDWVGLKIADAEVAEANAKYAAAEQALATRTVQAYFNVLTAWENAKFTQVEKTSTNRQLDQTKKRFEVGLISVTDVNEAQARYDLSVANEIRARNDLSKSQEQLRQITNKYQTSFNTLGESFHLINPVPASIDDWSDFAVTRNPELKSAEYKSEAARQEVNKQRAGHYPIVDFIGNIAYDKSNQDSAGDPQTEQNSIEFQMRVPIFQGGLISANTRAAAHQHESAKEQLIQQRRKVISDTRQAFLDVQANISRTKALEQAVRSNRSSLEATQSGFEVGTRTIVEVLNAQTAYHQAVRDAAQERYQYIINTVKLKQAAGTLTKADIQQINAWLGTRISVSS